MIQRPYYDALSIDALQGALNYLIDAINAYAEQASVVDISGNTTLTAAQANGGVLVLTGSPGAGFNLTLPATAEITRVPSGAGVPLDGTYQFILSVVNETGQTATLVAGDASTTITGTATVAASRVRRYLVTYVSGVTVTMRNIGAHDL